MAPHNSPRKLVNQCPVDGHLAYLQCVSFANNIIINLFVYMFSYTWGNSSVGYSPRSGISGSEGVNILHVGKDRQITLRKSGRQQHRRGLDSARPSQRYMLSLITLAFVFSLTFYGSMIPGQCLFAWLTVSLGTVFFLKLTRIYRNNATYTIASIFKH